MSEVPRLSPSIAKILLDKSPKHAWAAHRLLGGTGDNKPSAAQTLGKTVDALVFGTEFEATPAVFAKASLVAAAVKDAIEGRKICGTAQQRLEWEGSSNGYRANCSAVLDLVAGEHIYELKTSHDLSDSNIVKQIELLHYDLQCAAYVEAVRLACGPEYPVTLIFAETAAPYDVRFVSMTPRMLKAGLDKWHKAIRIWAQCMETGEWPGRGDMIADISSYRQKQEQGFVDIETERT